MILRLFAPFLPYCTEETWSWWQPGSIHRSPWPSGPALAESAGPDARPQVLDAVASVLVAVRRAKTEAKGSMRTRVDRCVVTGPPTRLELVELASGDLADAGAIARVAYFPDEAATALSVTVELASPEG